MILNEQLFRNYNELYESILRCYQEISVLEAYETLQKQQMDLYKRVCHISNLVVLLSQKDLALTIWKIYLDTNQNANTVAKFRNKINTFLKNSGYENKTVKKEKINKIIVNKLTMMRRQFLAHTDMTRSDSIIKICELKDVLDDICREFNRVCDVIDDDRVVKISEINIGLQEMTCYKELFSLYHE